MAIPEMTYAELQAKAIDECKSGGDPMKAIAFSVLALAEAIMDSDLSAISDILESRTIHVQTEVVK